MYLHTSTQISRHAKIYFGCLLYSLLLPPPPLLLPPLLLLLLLPDCLLNGAAIIIASFLLLPSYQSDRPKKLQLQRSRMALNCKWLIPSLLACSLSGRCSDGCWPILLVIALFCALTFFFFFFLHFFFFFHTQVDWQQHQQ